MHSGVSETQRRRRSILAVMTAVGIAGLGYGTSMPLLSILLEKAGYSSTLIGLNTALQAIAALIVLPFVPRALKAVGAARLLMLCLFTIGLALIAMRAFIDLAVWFPLRFVFGAAVAVMFTTSEFWVNSIADEHTRGRLVALYATVFSSGWTMGPLLLSALGPESWAPVLVSAGVLALAFIPLALGAAAAPAPEEHVSTNLFTILREAPVAALAPFVYGAVEIGVFALLPVYALREGLSAREGAYMLAALSLGTISLQYPMGWLADRIDRGHLLVLCALAGVLGAFSLPHLSHALPLLYGALLVWGGCVTGLYTVGLVLIGEQFKGPRLASANTAVMLLYSLGGLLAPPVSGLAMDLWPREGLALVLGLLCGAYALLAVLRPVRHAKSA
jgi:MFS family permease